MSFFNLLCFYSCRNLVRFLIFFLMQSLHRRFEKSLLREQTILFQKKRKQETRFNLLFLLWASTSEVCWQSRYLITAVQPGLQVGGCCLSFCIGPETVLVYTKVPLATRVQRCAAIYVKLYNAPGQRKYTGIYHEWAQPACVRKSP